MSRCEEGQGETEVDWVVSCCCACVQCIRTEEPKAEGGSMIQTLHVLSCFAEAAEERCAISS